MRLKPAELGACALAGLTGALYGGLVAHLVGVSVPIAAAAAGVSMAVIFGIVVARRPGRAT